MKTEAEIRRHRDNLILCRAEPCSCERSGHSFECVRGGDMMEAVILELSWALGEGTPAQDAHVAFLEEGARKIRARNN